ncbi:hypothetical protein HYH03_008065 [Edaphochlamys debaryana]|uniref:BHLH domain-containing protein n=1 Tax=Edaphochlamys debaryana TaxID=47281 RepID=A0A835YAA0_9CHLO|nr:hypothetical protein HYH03_008065 [Edaphochlamys debaryana]|eukprot:KAG2493849.1 hypothetical protein HYH03_008065 [Edaphochlamys debaryana]
MRNVGKTRSSDSRSSSAYASRHQAAEQRRRTRINERLELLRKLVPHAERANTACFLEEVIKYIEQLKRRTLELEAMLESATGKPVPKSLALPAGLSLTAGLTPENGQDSQAPSPRHPSSSAGQAAAAAAQAQANGNAGSQGAGGAPSSPTPNGNGQAPSQANNTAPTLQLSGPPLQLTASQQAAHQLLQQAAGQQSAAASLAQQQQAATLSLFPNSGGPVVSLNSSGGLSLASANGAGQMTGGLSLAQLAGSGQHGLLGHHGHGHHGHSTQLTELQTMQMVQTLQQQHQQQQAAAAAAAVAAASRPNPPPTFHPNNNKATLFFNEDYYGQVKPEALAAAPTRSLLGAAASTAPTTGSLQLSTVQLPADSTTQQLLHPGEAGTLKGLSGSPVTSEESGVPLKKRRVLML